MTKIISIFGSRDCPADVLEIVEKIAGFFAKKGWTLRTGGAIGCDEAGRIGFVNAGKENNIELYLPWQGYNNHYNGILHTPENWKLASEYVGHWDTLKLNHKIFHARNIAMFMGPDNKSPSDLAVCWTPEGEKVGGSATGIAVCEKNNIKLFNLGDKKSLTKLRKYCKKNLC
jgi:hypothetical protein